MHRFVIWTVAGLMAVMALVAGCVNVDIPDPPPGGYVSIGRSAAPAPTPQDRSRVSQMDKRALENEVLRLAAENNRLRIEVANEKRRNKLLDAEKDQLEDRVERLEDQIKDLRKR